MIPASSFYKGLSDAILTMLPKTLSGRRVSIRPAILLYPALLAGCLLSIAGNAVPAGNPMPFPLNATYDVSAAGALVGEFSMKLTRSTDSENNDQENYLLESYMQPSGVGQLLASGPLIQLSRFTIKNGRVVPYLYQETRPGDEQPDSSISFDWDGMTVKLPDGEILPIPRQPLDPAVAPLQVIMTPPSAERNLKVHIITKRGSRQHIFELTGETELTTSMGTINTLQVRERKHGASPGDYVDIWLAPDRGYVPVKIERHRKGRIIAMTLTELNGAPGI